MVVLAVAAVWTWRAASGPAGVASPSVEVAALLEELGGRSWPSVRAAAYSLETLQEKAIPGLLALASSNRPTPLEATGDLLYPGATGAQPGELVPYPLDTLGARAGWVLETITFQSFGYRLPAQEETRLLEEGGPLAWRPRPQEAAAAAQAWWERQPAGWRRMDGLVEALRTDNERTRLRAMLYLVAGDTPCSGLDEGSYRSRILPIVDRLSEQPLRDEHLRRMVLATRSPVRMDLTAGGVRPGTPLAEVERELGRAEQGEGEDRRWLRFPKADVRVKVGRDGERIEAVSADVIEREGKPILREGMTEEQVRAVLGSPWFGSGGRRHGQEYDFRPNRLRIRYREGVTSGFELREPRPPRRPMWVKPPLGGPRRTGRRDLAARH